MTKKIFELLCIDSKGHSVITNTDNLLNRLIGNGVIWKKPELKTHHIHDTSLGIKLTGRVLENNPDTAKISLIIKVEGEEQLEAFRLPLVKHLKAEKFDYIYILTDDVSKEISEKLYPRINEIENLLRKYLTAYFATRLGPKWWEDIANEELNKKVHDRKNNETLFSKHTVNGKEETLVDTKSFLIDFKDLGEIIYRISAGNLKSDDITGQIEQLDETNPANLVAAVKALKLDIKTNIKKYFPEFEAAKFQEKWEYLYYIRNKVAHNSLLSRSDKDTADLHLNELIAFLIKQNDDLTKLHFDPEVIAVYQENIIKMSSKYTKISKGKLAFELYKMNDWTRRQNRPFIGLKYFVTDILGIKGFDIGTSYDILNELKDTGYIEIFNYEDPSGIYLGRPPAIKVIKSLNDLFDKE